MLAVITTGGKQYIVRQGTIVKAEKLPGSKGDKVIFDRVLLLADEQGGEAKVGTPYISGAQVMAEILEQGRNRKVTVMKYKRKIRYRRKVGHRQAYTRVKINLIAGI